jgi:hypothetical protein
METLKIGIGFLTGMISTITMDIMEIMKIIIMVATTIGRMNVTSLSDICISSNLDLDLLTFRVVELDVCRRIVQLETLCGGENLFINDKKIKINGVSIC